MAGIMNQRWSNAKKLMWLEPGACESSLAAMVASVRHDWIRRNIRGSTSWGLAMVNKLPSGPGVYQLGVQTPDKKQLRYVYLGRTKNLRKRIEGYLRGAHIRALIDWHVGWGWIMVVRVKLLRSVADAVHHESSSLVVLNEDWNTHNNEDDIVLYPARFHAEWREEKPFRRRQLAMVKQWLQTDRKRKARPLPTMRIATSWPESLG